jgi:hypothetical protein
VGIEQFFNSFALILPDLGPAEGWASFISIVTEKKVLC